MITSYLTKKGVRSVLVLFLAELCLCLVLGAIFALSLAWLQSVLGLEAATVRTLWQALGTAALAVFILYVIWSRAHLNTREATEAIEVVIRLTPALALLLIAALSNFASKAALMIFGVFVFIGVSCVVGFLLYKLRASLKEQDDID